MLKEFFNVLWIIAAVPLVLLGCACGFFYAAFVEGCKIGFQDWNDI
jgi:hypothetical protein